jgi:hypothetical protein
VLELTIVTNELQPFVKVCRLGVGAAIKPDDLLWVLLEKSGELLDVLWLGGEPRTTQTLGLSDRLVVPRLAEADTTEGGVRDLHLIDAGVDGRRAREGLSDGEV